MRFTKMHGIGNDYVYLDAVTEPALLDADLPSLARAMADRHTGIGGDGLIVICPATDAPAGRSVRMRMFNADGSESEMCGNGVRCVAKYAFDHGLVDGADDVIFVQTGAGVLEIACTREDGLVTSARVDMGPPELELSRVPVRADQLAAPSVPADHVHGITGADGCDATFVSMGNPHAVIFVDDVASVALDRLGPRLERHAAFPNRMNIHFVEVHAPDEVTMRTWERGSGITLACGTGASAVCVAGVLTGRTARAVLAHLPGGDLELHWDDGSGHVFMTGAATEVFRGEWPCSASSPVNAPA